MTIGVDRRGLLERMALSGLAAALAFVVSFPFLWMLLTSFKPLPEVFRMPPVWIPRHPTIHYYATLLADPDYLRYFLNSLIVSGGTTAYSVVFAVLGGYAMARFRYRHVRWFARLLLLSYILPPALLLIPLFVLLARIHLVNTLWGLALVYSSFCLPYALWILKDYFRSLPVELEEAALLDGCTRLGALFRVTVPLSLPCIVAVGVFTFLLAWNEFLYALAFISSESLKTLPLGVVSLTSTFDIRWGEIMAISVLTATPVVLLFLPFQRYLVRGIAGGAVKG